jgi:hypothetical protein
MYTQLQFAGLDRKMEDGCTPGSIGLLSDAIEMQNAESCAPVDPQVAIPHILRMPEAEASGGRVNRAINWSG